MNSINIDLHCDLLSYLLNTENSIHDTEFRCSLPYLKKGNVKLQVMAIYTATKKNSSKLGIQQSTIFKNLLDTENFHLVHKGNISTLRNKNTVGIVASIENASSFCEEDMDLKKGIQNLETIIDNTQGIFYLGLTHHQENRFGGGNFTNIGLKSDGKAVIDYISDKNIAIDLSHTSDRLAYDILDYITKQNLSLSVIASHSNYRYLCNHSRNLPDELVKEIISRKGLIGLNFVKDFVDSTKSNPDKFYEHISYAIHLGVENHICYGADFFDDKAHPDQSRYPFFFDGFENAAFYNSINKKIEDLFGNIITNKISHQNVIHFLKNFWKQ